MLADVTSIQGNLSLKIDEAVLVPTSLMNQTARGNWLFTELTLTGAAG